MNVSGGIEDAGEMNAAIARALTDQIKVGVEAVWHLITRAYTERAWDILGYTSWDDYCTREFGTTRLRLPRENRAEVVSSLRDAGLSLPAIATATGLGYGTVQREVAAGYPIGQPEISAGIECDGKCATGECICPVADNDLAGVLDQELPPLPENYMNVPGDVSDETPGQTDRVADALAKAQDEAAQPKPAAPTPDLAPVIGIDGKRYPAKPAKPAPSRDARRPLVDTARDLGLDIDKIAKRIEKLGADDRLVRNRNEVAPRLRNHLESLIKVCQDLNHQLTQGA